VNEGMFGMYDCLIDGIEVAERVDCYINNHNSVFVANIVLVGAAIIAVVIAIKLFIDYETPGENDWRV